MKEIVLATKKNIYKMEPELKKKTRNCILSITLGFVITQNHNQKGKKSFQLRVIE